MSDARFWSPAWRSRPAGHTQVKVGRLLLIGVATLLLPALTIILLTLPLGLVTEPAHEAFEPGLADRIGGGVATVMLLTAFSPIYGIVLVPAAMALFVIAMRFGRAGWGVAGLAALVFALLFGSLFMSAGAAGTDAGGGMIFAIFMAPVTLFHAAMLWGLTRWLMPETLLPGPG